MKLPIPVGRRIMVEPEDPSGQLTSRIIAPQSAEAPPQVGIVLDFGSDCDLADAMHYARGKARMYIETGSRVVFSPYAGMKVTVGGKTLLFISPEDIVSVVVDDPLTENKLAIDGVLS